MGLVQSPLGGLILAAAGFLLLAVIVVWGLSPDHKARRPHLSAALLTATVVFLINMLARVTGVWQWYGYQLSLGVQVGMLFALPAVLLAVVVGGYRWLAARSRRPLLAYGLIGFFVLIPVTVAGDLYTMSRGTLSFGKGYTIFHDLIVGQLLFWLPVLLYTYFRRVRPSAAA